MFENDIFHLFIFFQTIWYFVHIFLIYKLGDIELSKFKSFLKLLKGVGHACEGFNHLLNNL